MTDDAFSSIDQVGQCMADEQRSRALQNAIKLVVKPGMRVVDVGTGTGLLAMFAAKAGAHSVVAIEYDPFIASVAANNIAINGLSQHIDLRIADATAMEFSEGEKFDVVVMELLTTGLIDEVQIAAIKNLHRRGVCHENTVFIPCVVSTFANLVQMDYRVCGLEMKMVRHLWMDFPDRTRAQVLTDSILINQAILSGIPADGVNEIIPFEIRNDGLLNGLYLQSETDLCPGMSLKDTLTLNAPVVLPLPEISVKRGDHLSISLTYRYGSGYSDLKVDVVDHRKG